MKFASPLIRGRLIKRYKRFLADVKLDDGTTITCTCPNTGSMLGLTGPGAIVWLSQSDNPTRKYRHTWEMIENDAGAGPTLVGINTVHPNKIVAQAIEAGRMAPLKGYQSLKREQKYGANSRIDILLEDDTKGRAYVEIKNVHLMRQAGLAEFPDSVTERGAKHLAELAEMARAGHRAVMVYLVQRADANALSLAADIDPGYAHAFTSAAAAGVEALAYRCRLSPDEIVIDRKIPVRPIPTV
ncbi:MAG TPA: DNA/RNA nuclease SfsA [Hyphomicrobiaceae bacterium]|nr:DNA/RNA nuclease SfsA [Hyphomicrobiaceae bacterium]